MPDDPHALQLYIDGSCYKNPGGPGGLACVAQFPDSWNRPDEVLFEEGFHETTNNRMELSACIRAFEYIAERGSEIGVQRVIIYTDSQYVYENYKGAIQWRRNGWRNHFGRPVENADLWKRYLTVRSKVSVRTDIHWKKGKKTPILKAVDRAAKESGKNPQKVDRGFRAGKIARSRIRGGASSMYVAKGQCVTIRVYRTQMIGKTGHKVLFDVFDDASLTYIEKCHAYAEPAMVANLHRQHCYRIRFNNNPKHPIIEELIAELSCPSV